MKITLIFLFFFALHIVHSLKAPPKPQRPRSFSTEVRVLLAKMAKENGYMKFDKCHIVDWDFMAKMILRYKSGTLTKTEMTKFINNLAKIHKSASFYDALKGTTRKELVTLTNKYHADAKRALATRNTLKLARSLFNMPSNLYPGDQSNNRSIKNRLDPPKADSGTGGRSDEATQHAKHLYAKYKADGLNIYPDPSSPTTRAKSSDTPPGDTSGDYVTIV